MKLMSDYTLKSFNLKGHDESFWSYYFQNSKTSIRYAHILALILYPAFGLLDFYMAPESMSTIWLIRFGFVTPFCLGAYLLTFSKVFERANQIVLFGSAIVLSFGILVMIAIVKDTELAYKFYYTGLILCIIWTHSILRLRHRLALLSTILTFVGYNVVVLLFQPSLLNKSEVAILINNNFFLIGAGIVGAWASSTTEMMFRSDFEKKQQIIRERNELVITKEKLQQADSIKNRLISIISHDIRNPISSVMSLIRLFNSEQMNTAEVKHFLLRIGETLNGTSVMLENMLAWSVMQIKDSTLQPANVNLQSVVEEVFTVLMNQALLKENRLINHVDPELEIWAEETMLKLVLRNLVSNAIKFTDKGKIEVTAQDFDDSVEISILDTGLGIPEHIAKNLFRWDVRSTTYGTKREKGSGIGLMICKEFVEKHGGKIFFETTEGAGTIFSVLFPKEGKNLIHRTEKSTALKY